MAAHFQPLPPVEAKLEALPPLETLGSKYSFVFRLDEAHEPVDPIIEAIHSSERVRNLPERTWQPQVARDEPANECVTIRDPSADNLWQRAHAAPPTMHRVRLVV